jgi:hypothetical protein
MMIRHLQGQEIDRAKWDALIAGAWNSLPYAYSWYLDATAPGWGALVQDDYIAVFPLTGKSRLGVHYLYQPFFTQQLGLYSKLLPAEKEVQAFLESIPAKYGYIDIYLKSDNHIDDSVFQLTARTNLLLDLDRPYEVIKKDYADNLKRNLKKAEKQGLVIKESADFDKAITFFKNNTGEKVENLSTSAYKLLRNLSVALKDKDMLCVFEVYSPANELVATALFVATGRHLINLLPSASLTGKELGATPLLLDYIIRSHAGKDIMFDFEGSMLPGVAQFYRSFGAAEQPYWHLKINRLPWYLKFLKK